MAFFMWYTSSIHSSYSFMQPSDSSFTPPSASTHLKIAVGLFKIAVGLSIFNSLLFILLIFAVFAGTQESLEVTSNDYGQVGTITGDNDAAR